MEIIDIQKVKKGVHEVFEVTFDDGDAYEGLKVILSREDMWQIAHYCHKELSYGVKLRKNKKK